MTGFLFDENLPCNVEFTPALPITHVSDLGKSVTDSQIWEYAKQNNQVIVTKDSDFSDQIMVSKPPPKVVHLRFGNMRKKDFHEFLKTVWPQIEELIKGHRLVNVYLDRLESIE